MELQYLLFCFALLASAASFSIPERFPEYGNDSLQDSSRCKCSDGRCVTDNRGNVKCVCKPKYALQDEFTCKPCDCGDKGQCLFTLSPTSRGDYKYEKKCVCDEGSAEKDGKCVDCYCGENSACEFTGEEKNCYCIEGYSVKDGKCTRCDCGFYGTCEFNRGEKQCTCDEGFLEKNGICEVACSLDRPCKNGGTCQNGHCICLPGTSGEFCEFIDGCEGLCPEQSDITCSYDVKRQKPYCECLNSNLKFDNERKQCQRTCDEKDRTCFNGGECTSSEYGNFCRCMVGTEGEFCEIVPECMDKNCGEEAKCVYDVQPSRAVCQCNDVLLSYDAWDKRCKKSCDKKQEPCQNGGVCTLSESHHFCRCRKGTEGDLCDEVPECRNMDCGPSAICRYDVDRGTAVCVCENRDLSFDPRDRICKKTCNDEVSCRNGGTCDGRRGFSKFCECLPGTVGDFCENVVACNNKDCGKEAECAYSVKEDAAVCLCKDENRRFHEQSKTCKKTCDDEISCHNGGQCESGRGISKFCECLPGTVGDFCENVVGCSDKDCGKAADCVYSVEERAAVCLCRDENVKFDEQSKTCKKTCDDKISCHNGGKCESGRGVSKFCECLPGTVGDFCENVVGCSDKDCGKAADCVYSIEERAAVCLCRDENVKFDEQSKTCKRTCDLNHPCSNGGKCEAGFCKCPDGTSGDYCELVPECDSKDCGSEANCTYSLERRSAVCTCVDERRSFDEVKKNCKRGCTTKEDCKNGGRCRKNGRSAFCDCLSETEGDLCEVVKDCNEGRTRCKGNDASCVFDQKKRKGACDCRDSKKRYDVVGEECKVTCSENTTCHNGGLCVHHGDHLFCECKAGTSGNLCEDVAECRRGLCGKSGKVDCIYNVSKGAAECKCKNRDEIFDPDKKTCKACDCGKNSISCRFKDGKKDCSCREGYVAKDEKCQKSKCTEKRCRNGKCQVVDDEEVCSCYEGYQLEGNDCTKLNCSKTPCYNGTCVVRRGNREECICQDGYSLKDGVCIRGACKTTNCYGGQCDIIDGELMCVCPKNYSLQGKGCYATVCKEKHCYGGSCSVNKKKEICTCLEGYRLVKDVCKKILCKKPCYGGECKFVDGKEECICPPGFSIFEDVCRENQAERRSVLKSEME